MVEKVLQLNTQISTQKNIFWTLIGTILLLAGFYIYSINATIHNVVVRQNLENEASQLTLSLSNEEFKYISMKNGVTLEMAHSLGFKDAETNTFVGRGGDAAVAILH